MPLTEINKLDAATDQLDWAIRLFLDHDAYVSAITLAGAAEEIIGEIVGPESAFNLLKLRLSEKTGLSPKIVSQAHLNKAKNWMKHWTKLEDTETIELDLKSEAFQYIIRAITNLCSHDKSCSSETPRFVEWTMKNMSC